MRRVRVAVLATTFVSAIAIPAAHGLAAAPWTLTGKVVTSAGTPLGNAVVGLSVMPTGALTAPTATTYITGARTAPDGTYTIPAPDLSSAALAQAAANDGWLNIELDAAGTTGSTVGAGAGTADYYGSKALAVLVGQTSVATATIGTVRSLPNDEVVTVEEVPAAVTDVPNDPCNWVHVPIVCSPIVPPPSPNSPTSQCGFDWRTVNQETDWEPVGEFHAWEDQTGWFSYGKTASTQLGVAFQYSGGNWQLNGSTYMGNSTSSTAKSGTLGPYWGHRINGQFAWAEDYSDNGCHPPAYRIRAEDWTGGFDSTNGADVSGNDGQNGYNRAGSGNQADLSPNTTFDRDDGTGYGYTWEVSAFGVSLNGETDYSTDVHMHWDMGSGNFYHSLFGFGSPPTASTLVFSW